MYRLFLSLFAISLVSSVAYAGGNRTVTGLPNLTCGSTAVIPITDIPQAASNINFRMSGVLRHSVSAENTSETPSNPSFYFMGTVRASLVFDHPEMGHQEIPIGQDQVVSTINLNLPGGYDGTPNLSGPSAGHGFRRNAIELGNDLQGFTSMLRASTDVHFAIEIVDCSSGGSDISNLVFLQSSSIARGRVALTID